MKKFTLITLVTSILTFSCGEKEKIIPESDLPQTGQTFLSTFFPETETLFIKKEGIISPSYEVYMQDGIKIEFDKKGAWTEIDMKQLPVPEKIIPAPVREYILKKFPDEYITKLERKFKKIEVTLSSRLELTFNDQYQLIEIDD